MTIPLAPLSVCRKASGFRYALKRLPGAEGGVAAIEFALVLPILLTLWIGGVEVTQALSFDRRLNNLAATIGDLVARSEASVTYAQIDEILDIATGAMYPQSAAGVSMVVSAVSIDAAGAATVAWSRAEGTTPARTVGEDLNGIVAETLRIPDTQIIMSEVLASHTPAVGYVLSGAIELEARMFYVPRKAPEIRLCEDETGANCLPEAT